MKVRNIKLLSAIVCIGGIIFFFACKFTYESKVPDFKQKARAAFDNAIKEELEGRKIKASLSFYTDVQTLSRDIPDSVSLGDSEGVKRYHLDYKKHCMNITDNWDLRSLHSFAFKKNPLIPDSLNAKWKKYLLKSHINAASALCISVMDENGKVKHQNELESGWCDASNLVLTVYIGYACEIEVKGYLDYSMWSIMKMYILLYLLLCMIFIYGIYKTSIVVQEKIIAMQQEKIIEVPIITVVEKMESTSIHSYMLHENIIFYPERKRISVGNINVKIPKQLCHLLELFLQHKNENYILKDDIIMQELWPNGSGSAEGMHKAVGRLRSLLKQADPTIDIQKHTDFYQLIL